MDIRAVVLAAGKGKRLGSEKTGIAKVMRRAAGRPLLAYVLEALDFIEPEKTVIVVGYKREQIIEAFPGYRFAAQEEQLGTGHALACARGEIVSPEADVLVCCGDMPMLRRETYAALAEEHAKKENACTVLTGVYDEKMAFGRIIRGADGEFERIVEQKDCTPEQDLVREYNSGVYVFKAGPMLDALGKLRNENAQGEYYLTDLPELIKKAGLRVGALAMPLGDQLLGVNNEEDLAKVEALLSR
jgi:UDP-N-acetylglucosamine diphosphorylase/glucosamine-1-phosphate N-acetyltransferase